MKTESKRIIDALGGVPAIVKLLGVSRHTVQAWKKRGIPARIQLDNQKLIAKGKRLAGINPMTFFK